MNDLLICLPVCECYHRSEMSQARTTIAKSEEERERIINPSMWQIVQQVMRGFS